MTKEEAKEWYDQDMISMGMNTPPVPTCTLTDQVKNLKGYCDEWGKQ